MAINEGRSRILLIGSKRDDDALVRRLKGLDVDVCLVQQKALLNADQLEFADEIIVLDYQRQEPLRSIAIALHKVRPFVAVISLTDIGVISASLLNDALFLNGSPSAVVNRFQDKPLMRKVLSEAHFSVVRSSIGSDAEDIREFGDEHGYPVIVKPVDGAGSTGVIRVEDRDQAALAVGRLRQLEFTKFLIEEYLDGPEFSIECFSFNGRHTPIAITDKLITENFVEVGHTVPAAIDDNTQVLLIKFVTQFLGVMGLMDGPSHTEVKLTKKGPRIIESHNRVGGDKINDLVRAVYGIDMVVMAFEWALGLIEPMDEAPIANGGAAVRFLHPPEGRVLRIEGYDEIVSSAHVLDVACTLRVGDQAPSVNDSDSRSGYVIVKCDNAKLAGELAERYRDNVLIETDLLSVARG